MSLPGLPSALVAFIRQIFTNLARLPLVGGSADSIPQTVVGLGRMHLDSSKAD